MNEFDAIQTLAAIGDTASAFAGMFFSVTFAYVTVAYLIGGALSRFQCMAVSALYVLSAAIFGLSFAIYADAWAQLKSQEPTIFDNIWLLRESMWAEEAAFLVVLEDTIPATAQGR